VREGKCILICAGDIALSDVQYDKDKDTVIAVDGGLLYCTFLQLEPDLIVGDFDSVDEERWEAIKVIMRETPEKVVRLIPEKDDTDTLAALRIGLEMGYENFHIYGGLGGRLEHTIANMQCLSFLKKQGAKGYLMGESTMVTVIQNETLRFRKEMEGFVSVFAMGEKAEHVTINGMKYLLDDATISNDFPVGISNEFVGEEGSITVGKGQLAVITSW